MGMQKTEVWTYNIINTLPNPFSLIASGENRPQQHEDISFSVEQSINFAVSDIYQCLVWSQSHLVEPDHTTALQSEYLNEISKRFPPYPILDAIKAIDEKMQGSINENPHAREARIAFKEGSKAAREVLKLKGLGTFDILRGAPVSLSTLANIDRQTVMVSGYYAAWDALHAKKTTSEEFGDNPFSVLIDLIRNGARNINLETITPTTPVEAHVFTRIGGTVRMVKWTEDMPSIRVNLTNDNSKET